MKKYIIYGAGMMGKSAFYHYGNENIIFFVDGDKNKWGKEFCGKKILSLDEAVPYLEAAQIIIASQYAVSMENKLLEYNISNYEIYDNALAGFFKTDELIVNPYQYCQEAENEDIWIHSDKLAYSRQAVRDEVKRIYGKKVLFNHIEIETVNRCNGVCSFCPVNSKLDPRKEKWMTQELFTSIIEQLEDLDYQGRFTTFSNNEPLLDKRIIEWNIYARKHLPHARMHLFTNGTLMTMDKFLALVDVLDELVIDNYQQELKLIRPCKDIAAYCEEHPELRRKVTIVLRKPNEILTSRGGDAPNRNNIGDYGEDSCVMPFKQMIIRPDGKVSLCCNDAFGKYTLGDASKEKLVDIWYGAAFEDVREKLYRGRKYLGNCRKCDTFNVR